MVASITRIQSPLEYNLDLLLSFPNICSEPYLQTVCLVPMLPCILVARQLQQQQQQRDLGWRYGPGAGTTRPPELRVRRPAVPQRPRVFVPNVRRHVRGYSHIADNPSSNVGKVPQQFGAPSSRSRRRTSPC
jgi:hypothetical protein